jgi:hypothetical protein
MADRIGVLLSGVLILAVYSYLIKENKEYSYAEHIYVGFVAAQASCWLGRTLGTGPSDPSAGTVVVRDPVVLAHHVRQVLQRYNYLALAA